MGTSVAISEAEHRRLQAAGALICQCRFAVVIRTRLFAANQCARCGRCVPRRP